LPSETDRARAVLAPYCQGRGLDIGCGQSKITPDAIGVDFPWEYNVEKHPHTIADLIGRWEDVLPKFRDGALDYVYSSHLLEDYADIAAPLAEWLRVIRPGGNLVLLLPIESALREWCARHRNPGNPAHRQNWAGPVQFLGALPPEINCQTRPIFSAHVPPYSFAVALMRSMGDDWFDAEFFTDAKTRKGNNRGSDNGLFFGHAQAITAAVPDHAERTILMVGNGRGWAARHLVHLGWGHVTLLDVSRWAVEHNALAECGCERCGAKADVQLGDVRRLNDVGDAAYDYVGCINVICYLAPDEVPGALAELKRVMRSHLFLSTATVEQILSTRNGWQGRHCIRPESWWVVRFAEAGLELDLERHAAARAAAPFQWVLRKT